jgi:hypothetical protein
MMPIEIPSKSQITAAPAASWNVIPMRLNNSSLIATRLL